MRKKLLAVLAIVLPVGIGGIYAVTQFSDNPINHSAGHKHASPEADLSTLTLEPGQGALAAMTEIAKKLRNDPKTDWSKVNLQGLRDHLIDMDLLVTRSKTSVNELGDGLEIIIDLSQWENDAASRMVPAHAPVLSSETGWNSVAANRGDLLIWKVTSPKNAEQIKALGFFGLMALGDHHREHHWSMATGAMVH